VISGLRTTRIQDNRDKFFFPRGSKLPDGVDGNSRRSSAFRCLCKDSASLARLGAVEEPGALHRVCRHVSSSLDLRGYEDRDRCRDGAIYHVAPTFFHELGRESKR